LRETGHELSVHSATPFSFNSRKATKKVGSTHFQCPTRRPAKPSAKA
jgi:hypothetical protein